MANYRVIAFMTQRSFRWLLVSLALFGFSVDLASKYTVFRWLYSGSPSGDCEIVPGAFRFHVDFRPDLDASEYWLAKMNGPIPPHVNHGALFGLGNEHTRLANGFFLVVSIIAAGAIGWWGTRSATRHDPLLSAALGLILGGTLGNLFDRAVFGGVRDFLHFYLIRWPVFNFADCCLVVGAGTLLFHALFVHSNVKEEASHLGVAVVAAE